MKKSTAPKTTEQGSPINWLKVIAEAAEAKAAQLQQQSKG